MQKKLISYPIVSLNTHLLGIKKNGNIDKRYKNSYFALKKLMESISGVSKLMMDK